MAVFKYEKTIEVELGEEVYLKLVHPNHGTDSFTMVDVPVGNDSDFRNEQKVFLGIGEDLLSERTLVYSKAFNVDKAQDSINLQFEVKDTVVVNHTNKKSVDESPQLKIKLKFTEV